MYSVEERERLFEQVRSNLEQAFTIAGGSEDELIGLMVQISQVVARGVQQQTQRRMLKRQKAERNDEMNRHATISVTGFPANREIPRAAREAMILCGSSLASTRRKGYARS